MGYLNDTGFSQFISPVLALTSAGTWSAGWNSNLIYRVRTAADAAFDMTLPIVIPSNSRMDKGSKLKSVDFMYYIATASPDAFAELDMWKNTFASDGTPTAASVPVTLESGREFGGDGGSAPKRAGHAERRITEEIFFGAPGNRPAVPGAPLCGACALCGYYPISTLIS